MKNDRSKNAKIEVFSLTKSGGRVIISIQSILQNGTEKQNENGSDNSGQLLSGAVVNESYRKEDRL